MIHRLPRETYVSLNEIPSQQSLSLPRSLSYNPLRQDDCDDWLPVRPKKTWFRMEKSWKSTVAAGVLIAGLVLLINLSFFVYIVKHGGFNVASFTLYTGV